LTGQPRPIQRTANLILIPVSRRLQYVGESERAVRQVFARARASAPCIIFFDELDALVPRRDDGQVRHPFSPGYLSGRPPGLTVLPSFHQSEATSRVVNTLLTELDGLESRRGIYVIGATNRPDMIDPAMARPGRLDKLLYVDLPTASERVEILKTMTRKTPLAPGMEAALARVASERCEGFSGADLAALVREAATLALRSKLEQVGAFEVDDGVLTFSGLPKDLDPANRPTADGAEAPILVDEAHFLAAAAKVNPSVSGAQRRKYEMLRNKMAGLPTKGGRKGGDLGEAGVGALGEGVAATGEGVGAKEGAAVDEKAKADGPMDE
jgi:ribosome biogenesis ATPase